MPLINKPTRVTPQSNSLLDNIFTNSVFNNCKCAVLYTDISDHYPILCQLNLSKTKIKTEFSKIYRRNYTDAAILKFITYLKSINWNISCSSYCYSEPNSLYEKFLELFKIGFNDCFPLKDLSHHRKNLGRNG